MFVKNIFISVGFNDKDIHKLTQQMFTETYGNFKSSLKRKPIQKGKCGGFNSQLKIIILIIINT